MITDLCSSLDSRLALLCNIVLDFLIVFFFLLIALLLLLIILIRSDSTIITSLLLALLVTFIVGSSEFFPNVLDLSYGVLLRGSLLFGRELDLRCTSESERSGESFEGVFVELEDGLVLLQMNRSDIGDESLAEGAVSAQNEKTAGRERTRWARNLISGNWKAADCN